MKYKTLVLGNNNLIIDDFFVQMSEDLEVMSCSSRYGDIIRHIKYFAPDVFVFCMYNEKEESIRQMVNIKPMLKKAGTPVVIIGTKEDCVEFNKIAINVSDMDLMRPFTAVSIRDAIVKYMDDHQSYFEAKRGAQAEAPSIEKSQEVDIDSLRNVLSSLDAAINAASSNESSSQAETQAAPKVEQQAAPKSEQQTEPQTASASANNETAKPKVYSNERKHILVVDDDPIMLKMVKEQLRDAYDVATAISGKIAMKFLERKMTDLILLDYEMPDESGPDVLEKLRENTSTKDIPVVFLTGVSDKSKIQEAIALRPQGYLLKPIDHDKLMSTINSTIGY